MESLNPIKAEHNITVPIGACHTALVEGYVVEGHVPAKDIARLLAEKPDIAGIAAPGMPGGSPGMEHQPSYGFRVVAFDKSGHITEVFASH